jgi:hypothetical protein
MEDKQLATWILKVTVGTLAAICLSVVAVLLIGMFDDKVDNKEIFSIIGPAFSTVIGAFVGLLGGLSINKSKDCGKKD